MRRRRAVPSLGLLRRRLLMLRWRCGVALSLRPLRCDVASAFGARLLPRGWGLALQLHPVLPPLPLRLLRCALVLPAALCLRRLLLGAALLRWLSWLLRRLALQPLLLALAWRLRLWLLLRLRLLSPLLALLLGLQLLPIGRSLARGRRRLRTALRGARRPVAETATRVGGERLRRLHPIGRAHDLLRLAQRRLGTEIAPAQILRAHLHGSRNGRGASEHCRPHVVGAQRPPGRRGDEGRSDAGVHREAPAIAGHHHGPVHDDGLMDEDVVAGDRQDDRREPRDDESGPRTKIQNRGSSTYSTITSSGGNGAHPT
jgi:hypothetical protein